MCRSSRRVLLPIWLGAPFPRGRLSTAAPTCCLSPDSQKARPLPCRQSRDGDPSSLGRCSRPTELGSFLLTLPRKMTHRSQPWPAKHPLSNFQLKIQTSFLGGDDFRGANAVNVGHPAGTGGLPNPEFVPKPGGPGLELRLGSQPLLLLQFPLSPNKALKDL